MKNKVYYFEQGRKWAMDNVKTANPLALTGSDSWQAKAFRDGINSTVSHEAIGGKCTHGITSHLKNLVEQWKRDSVTNPYGSKLSNRIYGKIKFLCKKHKLNHVEIFNSVDWPIAV